MRNFDFAPLSRSTIGFDRMMRLFDDATRMVDNGESSYPPYNIEKTGEDTYRITLAVAGFEPDELTVTSQPNQLVVAGRKARNGVGEYLHQGIAARAFQRQFNLADFIRVTGASLRNGMLAIELQREVPEAAKPRRIAVGGRKPHQQIEGQKAA
jgi:molecular chaperone IbpA